MICAKFTFVIPRPLWIKKIQGAWDRAGVVWLTGVRRVGKTTLARAFDDALYLNCDLPAIARELADPERFLKSVSASTLILDEVHQLPDPSRVLKIAADVFPKLKVIATGSSTLAATTKFRDSLAGRKRSVELLPVLDRELEAFGVIDLQRRLMCGGLPEPLLAAAHDPTYYAEWLDSYYARDVEELFRIGKRRAFITLVELLLRQSGGLLEITNTARLAGIARQTAMGYIDALEITHVLFLVRPFHAGGRQEVLHRPKAYAFDTGFVVHARGWNDLRPSDCGLLWEHVVLDMLRAGTDPTRIRYWRDRAGHEIDFILAGARGRCDAIECKWTAEEFEPKALRALRALHPSGRNFLVSPHVERPFVRAFDGFEVLTCTPLQLLDRLAEAAD